MRFKVHRRLTAECAVEPRAVIKDFDPLEDGRARVGARGERLPMDQAAFERASEAFHHGVVVAVAPTAHARDHARLGQSLAISTTGVLDAPVGMMHQSGRRLALGQGHVQCRQWQDGRQRIVKSPADAAARAPVQHPGDMSQPSAVGT